MGDVPQTTTTNVEKKIYNKYNYFEIPVLLGYQFDAGNWTIGVQGGAYLGFLTSLSGQISGMDGDEVKLEEVRDELFRSKFSAAYYIGGLLSYNLPSGISVYLKPHLRISPHDTSSGNYPVSTKYLFVGGNVGFSYRFGK